MGVSVFDVFRRVLPDSGQHKGTSNCQDKECLKSTREGKPFCSMHIEQAPYIKNILRQLADRNEEAKLLEKRSARLDPDSFFIRETLLLLRTKDFTSKALGRHFAMSNYAAKRLIAQMHRDGLAKEIKTGSDVTISGLGERDLREPEE